MANKSHTIRRTQRRRIRHTGKKTVAANAARRVPFAARLAVLMTEVESTAKGEPNQSDFARRVGISRRTLDKWISGDVEPGADNLRAISAAFAASTDWLLGLSDERTERTSRGFLAEDFRDYLGSCVHDAVALIADHLPTEHLHAAAFGYLDALAKAHREHVSRGLLALADALSRAARECGDVMDDENPDEWSSIPFPKEWHPDAGSFDVGALDDLSRVLRGQARQLRADAGLLLLPNDLDWPTPTPEWCVAVEPATGGRARNAVETDADGLASWLVTREDFVKPAAAVGVRTGYADYLWRYMPSADAVEVLVAHRAAEAAPLFVPTPNMIYTAMLGAQSWANAARFGVPRPPAYDWAGSLRIESGRSG